jgi:hypothetical protein
MPAVFLLDEECGRGRVGMMGGIGIQGLWSTEGPRTQ